MSYIIVTYNVHDRDFRKFYTGSTDLGKAWTDKLWEAMAYDYSFALEIIKSQITNPKWTDPAIESAEEQWRITWAIGLN